MMRARERERARDTSSLQPDSLSPCPKKRSFSLPSFRRSSAGERQEVARTAEEAARVQKAAAWQWYTRGVGEPVVPTKRPSVGKSPPSQAPPLDVVDGRSKGGAAITHNNNVQLQKKPLEQPPPESPRAASRFKAEASFAQPTSSAGAQPIPSAPSAAPSTPLYDEFELSGLRTQMADFVQRLQTKDNEQSPTVADHRKSKPLHSSAIDARPLPSVAAAIPSDQHLTKPAPPSSAPPPPSSVPPVASTPFHMRPFSALNRLFRKVVSGSIIKSTKNYPLTINSSPVVYEPEVLPEDAEENSGEHHYHHYIHHHHHHYHYGESTEESAAVIRSRRRHSDSSGIRPHTPSLWEAESDEEVERSPIEAYLARRRRHSDNFAGNLTPKKASVDEDEEEMKGGSAKVALPPTRFNSERFSPNKIPTMDIKDVAQPAAGATNIEGLLDIKSRRHSAENKRELGEALERKVAGRSGGGTYKLNGTADGATPAKQQVRRRNSEGMQRAEGIRTPSLGTPYRHSPSARYLEDMLERQIGASARRPRAPPWDLPPIYPH